MHGRAWRISVGSGQRASDYCENPLQQALDRVALQSSSSPREPYQGIKICGLWSALKGILYQTWETWWHQVESRVILLPSNVYGTLVKDVRKRLEEENEQPSIVTTGDILTAWLFKTVFETAEHDDAIMIHCSYFISFRKVFPSIDLTHYPHNCHVPLAHPLVTLADLKKTPLHILAISFARSRLGMTSDTALNLYHTFQMLASSKAFLFHPMHEDAYEALLVSNVSSQQIVETDWSCAGAVSTLCSYRSQTPRIPIMFKYLCALSGRLGNGTALLEAVLRKSHWIRVEAEVNRLIEKFAHAS